MKKNLIACLLIALCAMSVWAKTPKKAPPKKEPQREEREAPRQKLRRISGEVDRISRREITVYDDGHTMVFDLTPDTEFENIRGWRDIRSGDMVEVLVEGRDNAVSIRLLPPRKAPPKKAPPKKAPPKKAPPKKY